MSYGDTQCIYPEPNAISFATPDDAHKMLELLAEIFKEQNKLHEKLTELSKRIEELEEPRPVWKNINLVT